MKTQVPTEVKRTYAPELHRGGKWGVRVTGGDVNPLRRFMSVPRVKFGSLAEANAWCQKHSQT